MIIFDEQKYISDMIANKKVDKMGIKKLIGYIARYYYNMHKEYSKKQLVDAVKQQLKSFQLPANYYMEYKYDNYIKTLCGKIIKGKVPNTLKVTKEIILTKPEIEIIKSAPSEKAAKLLFTFYILAKNRDEPNGWVNYKISDVFEYADVSASRQEKYEILGSLYHLGLIELNRMMGKSGYKVKLEDGDPEIAITNFRHFGRQYIALFKDGWTMCRECEKLIKTKSHIGRPLMYCRRCAEEIKRKQSKESVYRLRNNVGKNLSS